MSVRVMSWVFEQSRSKKNARLVLLAIADCANDEGRQAYPSTAKLMQKTGLSERGVQSAVKALAEMGELFVDMNGGPRGCNLYRVIMDGQPPQEMPPAEPAGEVQILRDGMSDGAQKKRVYTPAESAPRNSCPPQETTETPAESAPGTIKEPSKNSSSKSSARAKPARRIPDDFRVTEAMIAWAREHTPVVGAAETAQFIDHHRAKGSVMTDWVAAWRTWMRNAQKFTTERNGGRSSPTGARSSAPEQIPADERCPRHRDQRKTTCRACRAERLGGDQ